MLFQSALNSITRFIRELYRQLFNKTSPNDLISTDNLVSETMAEHLSFCQSLYENNTEDIEWLRDGKVKSLRLPTIIAREIARIVCSEASIKVDGNSERAKYLDKQLQIFLKKLPVYVEQAVALGNLAFKPFMRNGDVYVSAARIGSFVPINIDAKGNFTACVFVEKLTKGNDTYTRLEYHHAETVKRTNDNGIEETAKVYIVENTAYYSSSKYTLGRQIKLTDVPEWSEYAPFTQMDNVKDNMLYSVYVNPFANSVDLDSPLGVSVYSDCIDLIKEADEMWELITYEMKSGERKVFGNAQTFRNVAGGSKLSRFYKVLEFNNDDEFKDFSPQFRNEFIEARVQSIFKRIEQNAGLSFGTISDPMAVAKTATEIKYSNHRLHVTVSSIQTALRKAIEQLVTAMDNYCNLYQSAFPSIPKSGDYQLICDWDDSVIESKADKQARAATEYQMGIIDEVQYFVEANGMTEEEAEQFVQKMRSRSPQMNVQKGQDWFKENSGA